MKLADPNRSVSVQKEAGSKFISVYLDALNGSALTAELRLDLPAESHRQDGGKYRTTHPVGGFQNKTI